MLQTSKAKYNSVVTVHQTSASESQKIIFCLWRKQVSLAVYLLLSHMSNCVQVEEVTLEGRPSVREVHLQDGGFGPAEEASVQVIMMGHTTLNVFTTTQIYKYTNTHKYRNTQRKEMSHYSQCNVSQLSLHHTSMWTLHTARSQIQLLVAVFPGWRMREVTQAKCSFEVLRLAF